MTTRLVTYTQRSCAKCGEIKGRDGFKGLQWVSPKATCEACLVKKLTFTDNTPVTTENGIIKMERCVLPDTWHNGTDKDLCLDCRIAELQREEREGQTQRACDKCTQGVMDWHNPHRNGRCGCACHQEAK